MNDKTVAVIGAGPAGLTAAYELAKKGIRVDVFEAGDSVGGMAKTISLWGQRADLGPHRFFSSDPRVNRLWLEVVGRDYSMVNRLTRIYYQEIFFDYPLKPVNALQGLGLKESLSCMLSYGRAKLAPQKNAETFESWVIDKFGARLFEIFFKSYSEKLWGIPCSKLDADFAAQRIKKLSLFEAVKSALAGNRRSKHKTLVDEFAYPHMGAGVVYERMAGKVDELGGKIFLRTLVDSVRPGSGDGDGPFLKLADGRDLRYDHVISSMPITLLIERLGAPDHVREAARSLRFRNTILVYLHINGDSPFPDQWIYVHSPDLKTGRITNFRNWVPHLNNGCPDTILCLEYWCYDDDQIWTRDEGDLVRLATDELHRTGLVIGRTVLEGKVIRVPRCYPVYEAGYKTHVKKIEDYLSSQPAISVIGRYGSFKYNNQDHSILMGLLAAENISEGASHNLWEINTDYEYQESSRITATGLALK